jgi:hypothetical protein
VNPAGKATVYTLSSNITIIDVTAITSSVYFVKVKTEKEVIIKKVIKELSNKNILISPLTSPRN